jgi:hypothetical protein
MPLMKYSIEFPTGYTISEVLKTMKNGTAFSWDTTMCIW